jgi:hypothetical protein
MRLKRRLTSQLVGMTSKSEQDFCSRYGRELYTGVGEVVDLGCWLGSTTISLARGLRDNSAFIDKHRKVHAYDLFVWFDWMDESLAGTDLVGRFAEGDSFLKEFERRVSDHLELIEIHAGDLTVIRWQEKPIEFLLVDAMKNWDLANAILRDFYPYLIPGKSMVMHQDFAFSPVPWIHVLQWKLREYFEVCQDVPASPSLVFKFTRAIPAELLTAGYSYDSFSRQNVDETYEYFLDRVSPAKKPNVAAAKVTWFLEQDKVAEAAAAFDDLLRQGVSLSEDMLTVKDLVESRTKAAAGN